jgi:hypothetical protein
MNDVQRMSEGCGPSPGSLFSPCICRLRAEGVQRACRGRVEACKGLQRACRGRVEACKGLQRACRGRAKDVQRARRGEASGRRADGGVGVGRGVAVRSAPGWRLRVGGGARRLLPARNKVTRLRQIFIYC